MMINDYFWWCLMIFDGPLFIVGSLERRGSQRAAPKLGHGATGQLLPISTISQSHLSMYTSIYPSIINTYINIHIYIYTYIHTYIHTYKNTYIHTYIHTYIYIYIHTEYMGVYIYIMYPYHMCMYERDRELYRHDMYSLDTKWHPFSALALNVPAERSSSPVKSPVEHSHKIAMNLSSKWFIRDSLYCWIPKYQ